MEGRTVSHYHVTDRLGGGAMGVVYKAVDTHLDRLVALKFLPSDLTPNQEARMRLVREAKAVSALDHPNICTIHDIDSTPEGLLFLAMSYYDGETLKQRIARGPLDVDEALDIAIQVARGLESAHAAGIVHRDIKPANLIITRAGVVKIVDFGIAAVAGESGTTQTGLTLGTVAYMSPEQINGLPIDGRSDIWSLGATLYEMLTARPLVQSDRLVAAMNAIVSGEFVSLETLRPDLPRRLVQLVGHALSRSRADRFRTVAEFERELTACRAALAAPARFRANFWRGLMGG